MNFISGSLPVADERLALSAQHIDLLDNLLTGQVPPSIFSLSQLDFLQLSRNYLSGRLEISNNCTAVGLKSLNESFPFHVDRLALLEEIDLSKTHLSSTLPDHLYTLSSLQSLALYGNNLIGTINESIGNLTSLEILSLADCYLFGTFPSSIGDLSSMMVFYISQNFFYGSIPATLSKLRHLQICSAYRNEFDGYIPDVSAMQNLTQVFLYENDLFGTFPATGPRRGS